MKELIMIGIVGLLLAVYIFIESKDDVLWFRVIISAFMGFIGMGGFLAVLMLVSATIGGEPTLDVFEGKETVVYNLNNPCAIYDDRPTDITQEMIRNCCDENGCKFEGGMHILD